MKDKNQNAKRAVKIIKKATKQAYAVAVITKTGVKVMTITGYWTYPARGDIFHGALQIFPTSSAIQQAALEEGYQARSVIASSSIAGGVGYDKVERVITSMLVSMKNIINKGLGVALGENCGKDWERKFLEAGYMTVRIL